MRKRGRLRKILFVQLPRLENDTTGVEENPPLAAACLTAAAMRAGESAHFEFAVLDDVALHLDDQGLVGAIAAKEPDVLACTLYLWNVERTLHVMRRVKAALPDVRVAGGGPDVAFPQPFLFRSRVFDFLAAGEGEAAFLGLLQGLRTGRTADLANVARLRGGRYVRGSKPVSRHALAEAFPAPGGVLLGPDARGTAYLEASRGCALSCTYCRYPPLRRRMRFLEPERVEACVRRLRARGAREIRFIDPTFNAHPGFTEILRRLARLNGRGGLEFFAELRAERLEAEEAALLAKARFTGIEVGVQSTRADVLARIKRPARVEEVERGIRLLLERGIETTVDLMYGLPGQTLADFEKDLDWAMRFRGARVQGLQTLLLPGTELARTRRRWGMRCDARPPYGVRATAAFSEADMAKAERLLRERLRRETDSPTRRFVGVKLPDLFPERVALRLEERALGNPLPGHQARRALRIEGGPFWPRRELLLRLVRRAVRCEPHALWQFVLRVDLEEPLNLLDALIAELRAAPPHLLDRYAFAAPSGLLAARRVFLELERGKQYDPTWIDAAEARLASAFY